MHSRQLTTQDKQLIDLAKEIIIRRYEYGRHHIASVLRTKQGKIYTGIHLDLTVRRAAICAEAIALGKAVSEGVNDFDIMVAVRHTRPDEEIQQVDVVSPCGICRELLFEYCPDLQIIVPNDNAIEKFSILELLPIKFSHR
ncbi:MAG: cytidine deaminase [Deltaproteobacteria bacterium]|nr:cytidine deaminase [Deltaproteobacteria bacterium]